MRISSVLNVDFSRSFQDQSSKTAENLKIELLEFPSLAKGKDGNSKNQKNQRFRAELERPPRKIPE